MTGKLFVLEGGEAAGKSLQLRRLVELLERHGYPVTVAREPGGTTIGEMAREIIIAPRHKRTIQPLTTLFLLNAARHQLMYEVVKPALAQGRIVLTDRSFLSSMVYQAHVEGLDAATVKDVCFRALDGVMPDKIFFIDISMEEMKRRLEQDAVLKDSRYDTQPLEFHAKVREGYLKQIEAFPGLIEKIDGEAPVEEITDVIAAKIFSMV